MNVPRTPAQADRVTTATGTAAAGPEAYEYTFPAVRGIQTDRWYYTTMLPLRLVARLFRPGDPQPDPGQRAQRQLSKARIPQIAAYLTANPDSYILPALVAIADDDGRLRFDPASDTRQGQRLGTLAIPLTMRLTLADGQHRAAAITQALAGKDSPLGNETIPVTIYTAITLARSQQAFA